MHVRRGQQRDAMGRISIQVDASNIALFGIAKTTFMSLEEEVRPIRVVGVVNIVGRQEKIGGLIRLCLRSLDVMRGGLDVPWRWEHGPVTIVTVEQEVHIAVFERRRTLRDHYFGQLG